ncbi:ComF family protein [Candidatus Parcubacteria bacterium]|nr:MAG: ComF family protein [Candidatus Parcubacteria bacterium]
MQFGSKFKIFKNFLSDLIFPKSCFNCGKSGIWFCHECYNRVILNSNIRCPFCKLPGGILGQTCFNCRKTHFLDGVIAATEYKNTVIKKLVHKYKYDLIKDLEKPSGWLIADYIEALKEKSPDFFKDVDFVVPVPLSVKKTLARGFNQSELLSKRLSNHFKWPMAVNSLQKIKSNKRQVNQKKIGRRQNVRDKYALKDKFKFKSKKIFLIDDVATTGSTLDECAKIMKKAGAREVWGIVLSQD